jgi:hypothetical protein
MFEVAKTNTEHLLRTIEEIRGLVDGPEIEIEQWEASRYRPTPTIIEATLALYRGHSVAEISRSDADATNLSITADTVASIIATTKTRSEKAICFVTGVPGAGKTLVDSMRRRSTSTMRMSCTACSCRVTARWLRFFRKPWHVTRCSVNAPVGGWFARERR